MGSGIELEKAEESLKERRKGMIKEVGNLQLQLQEKPRNTGHKPDVVVISDKCVKKC